MSVILRNKCFKSIVQSGDSQFQNCNDINQLGVIPISKPDSRW